MPEDLKVGVFICECGGNISDTVDIQKVKDSLNVEVVEQFVNLCSLNSPITASVSIRFLLHPNDINPTFIFFPF